MASIHVSDRASSFKGTILHNSEDYEAWHRSLLADCKRTLCWNVLTGVELEPTGKDEGETDVEFRKRKREYSQLLQQGEGILQSSIGDGVAAMIINIDNGPAQYKRLKEIYKRSNYTSKIKLWQDICLANMSVFDSAEEYGHFVQRKLTELESLTSKKIEDWLVVGQFMGNLDDSFALLKELVLGNLPVNGDGTAKEPTFQEVLAKVIDHERRQEKVATAARASTPYQSGNRGQSNRPPRTPNANGQRCFHCESPLHLKDKCWYKHPDLASESWRSVNKTKIEDLNKKAAERYAEWEKEKTQPSSNASASAAVSDVNSNAHKVYATSKSNGTGKDQTWYIDSAATTHLTFSKEYFERMEPTILHISLADGSPVKAIGVGIATIPLMIGGRRSLVKLSGVHYCPELSSNLISVGLLESKGLSWMAKDGLLLVKNSDGETIIESHRKGNLYAVNQPQMERVMRMSASSDEQLWHRRLGHLGYQDLHKLQKMVNGMTIQGEKPSEFCEICTLTKQTRSPHKASTTRATAAFQRVHIDLCGGGNTLPSKGGIRYFMPFTDDFTRYKYIYFLKSKDEARKAIQEFIARTRTEFEKTIVCFRADNAKEFKETRFQQYTKELGIQWEWSAPYAHGQNGVAERVNRTIAARTRSILKDAGLSEAFWVEAMKTALYLLNRSPTGVLQTTPYEALVGAKPDLSDLHVFGCDAYVYDEERLSKKLSDRSWKGIFLGYEGKHQYRIYNPQDNQVYIRRDVRFNELHKKVHNSDQDKCISTQKHWEFSDIFVSPFLIQDSEPNTTTPDAGDTTPLANVSAENPIFYDAIEDLPSDNLTRDNSKENDDVSELSSVTSSFLEDMLDSATANQHEHEQEPNNTYPDTATIDDQTSTPEIATSSRPSRNIDRPDYRALHRGNFVGAVVGVASPTEPSTYEEAINGPHSVEWQKGMRSEYDSHMDNGTWHLEKLPHEHKALPGRWVYRLKQLPDGGLKYKARWVVKGFAQKEDEYDETFATVVRANTTMVLFAIATQEEYYDEMMDVVTAFLNSTLKEDIWMEQPHGFVQGSGLVCKLRKTLYGLKQSPRAWYDTLCEFLMSLGFARSMYDHALFLHTAT
jgi:transposase InsO family protein